MPWHEIFADDLIFVQKRKPIGSIENFTKTIIEFIIQYFDLAQK